MKDFNFLNITVLNSSAKSVDSYDIHCLQNNNVYQKNSIYDKNVIDKALALQKVYCQKFQYDTNSGMGYIDALIDIYGMCKEYNSDIDMLTREYVIGVFHTKNSFLKYFLQHPRAPKIPQMGV